MSTMTDDPAIMTCGHAILEEIQQERVNLEYNRPSDFVNMQWPLRKRWFLLYRCLIAFILTCCLIGDLVYEIEVFYIGEVEHWFIFATNWSFMLLIFSAIFQAATCALYNWKSHVIIDPQYSRTMPTILRCQWVLINFAYNSSLVVTTAYWMFITLMSTHKGPVKGIEVSSTKHTANSLYIFLDIMVIASPFRIFHMFFAVGLGSCYVVFNALYFLTQGIIITPHATDASHVVYSLLNWHQPVKAIITCTLSIFLAVVAQLVLFLVFRLRVCIWQMVCDGDASSRYESELQNIVVSQSASYNTIEEIVEEKKPFSEKKSLK